MHDDNDKPDVTRFFAGRNDDAAMTLPTAELMSAGRIAGFDGRHGWPDELSIGEFSAIQFKDDGRARADFLRATWSFDWVEWFGEHGVTVIRDNAPGPGLCRASAAECLRLYGVEPSRMVMAWLDSPESLSYRLVRGRNTADAGHADSLPPSQCGGRKMKRKAIINQLESRFPSLVSDFNRMEDWVKKCSTGERGMYYLEKIEAGCLAKWSEPDRAPATSHSATKIHRIK